MNYFNYYTEIEDAFVRRRAKHLFLSPMDWALMETWKEQGVPLHIVLRGIEKSFDSYEAKPRKRSVKSLLYCQEEVEAQFDEWVESRVGSNTTESEPGSGDTTETTLPFSSPAVDAHLKAGYLALTELANSRRRHGDDDFSEALLRAAALLEEIRIDFVGSASPDARRLEDSLTGLERMLGDSMFSVVSGDQLDAVKKEIKQQLAPYRSQMDSAVYTQTLNNLLLKRLREQFAVPRLSLFYL